MRAAIDAGRTWRDLMLARRRNWLIATIALFGVSISGYAYALSCAPNTETLKMELVSVTYDGVPQADLPEYRSVDGQLTAYEDKAFELYLGARPNANQPATQLEGGSFDVE
jgi:hypothetical protein